VRTLLLQQVKEDSLDPNASYNKRIGLISHLPRVW